MKIFVLVGIITAAAVSAAVIGMANQTEANSGEIRVAFFPTILHAVPIVGMENGEFADDLGDIPIRTVIVDSGPHAIEALFANSADLAYVGPGPLVNGYVQSGGDKIKILSGAAANGASLVVQKDSKIATAADLAGKKVAAPSIGNTQDVSLRTYLSENDLVPAERGGNVIVYNTANPEIFTLFAKGDIDAAWVPEPTATLLVEQLGGERLFQEEEIWEGNRFSSVLLIGRVDFIEQHPDWTAKWIAAHERTVTWINEHPDETPEIFIDFYKKHTGKVVPENIMREAFSKIIITTDTVPDSIHTFAEQSYSLGYLGRSGYDLGDVFYNVSKLGGT